MERFRELVQKEANFIASSKGSLLLSKQKFDSIVDHLKHPDKTTTDAHFRHWVKKKQFSLMNMPGVGLLDVLVVPNGKSKVGFNNMFLFVFL